LSVDVEVLLLENIPVTWVENTQDNEIRTLKSILFLMYFISVYESTRYNNQK
jgi:hypothetical protein